MLELIPASLAAELLQAVILPIGCAQDGVGERPIYVGAYRVRVVDITVVEGIPYPGVDDGLIVRSRLVHYPVAIVGASDRGGRVDRAIGRLDLAIVLEIGSEVA